MPVPLTADQRQVMQAVYDHFRKNGSWPTLAAIAVPCAATTTSTPPA